MPTTPNNVAVQEDKPVVQIHALRIGEVKAGEVSLGADDCMPISDPSKDLYKDLGALFCEPVDKKIVLLQVHSFNTVKPFEHTIVSKSIPQLATLEEPHFLSRLVWIPRP